MLSNLRKAFRKEAEPGPGGFYQPKARCTHTSVLINKDIFVWAGALENPPQGNLTEVHMSNLRSVVEVFHGGEGRWEQHSTTGTPPLGVLGCANCAINHKIYYFGGLCTHSQNLQNSIHELDTDEFKWTVCLANSDKGPMKKNFCGMVAFHQSLLVVAGVGKNRPKNHQPLAQYDGKGLPEGQLRTNEHHIHALGSDQWSSPAVSGNKPPPTSAFTLSKIADEKALMYGGSTPAGGSSDVRVASVILEYVHWERLVPRGPERPKGRWYHAVSVIHSPLMGDQQTVLLVTGGEYAFGDRCNDSWLLSVNDTASWKKVNNIPLSVSGKTSHSIDIIATSHTCVWLMAVGGYPYDSNVVTLLELNLSPNGQWELSTALKDGKAYQGYFERFSHKFPEQYEFEATWRNVQAKDQQERDQQLEQQSRQIQEKDQRLHLYQQQLREKDQQIQMKGRQIQEKDQQIQEKDQQIREKNRQIQEKDQQIQDKDRQIQEKDQHLQNAQQQFQKQLKDKDRSLERSQQQVQQLRSNLSRLSTEPWVISRDELTLTEELLGTGAYGEVKVAVFRGLRVAAKFLHNVIISDYNLRIFSREMNIASRVRHPNLLLFIGATTQGHPPVILTELMATSLRTELSRNPLSHQQVKSIASDIVCGLNYLHLWKPHPIIHRDISSPNVLMKPSGSDSWEAKVSDYGSANFIQQIGSYSVAPGNPAYAAPEAKFPDEHTPKMDVYSLGVLLVEMDLQEQPEMTVAARAEQAKMVQWDSLFEIIEECMDSSRDKRPTLALVLEKLRQIEI